MTKRLGFLKMAELRMEQKMTGCSISLLSRKHHLSWHTVERALKYRQKARKKRETSVRVRFRRLLVASLTEKTLRFNGRIYPKYPSAGDIRDALLAEGETVSKRTVCRDLHAQGFSSLVRRRVPTRDPEVLRKRLSALRSWKSQGLSSLTEKLVFSDEHTISINDHSTRRMWVKSGANVIPRERRRLQNIPRIQVWAAIGVSFKSPIVMFPDQCMNPDSGRRETGTFRLNGESYVKRCLRHVAEQLRCENRLFQHDGAKPHQNNRVREYLLRKHVNVLDPWPPYSPDLNMIELLWPRLNALVAQRHPNTVVELKQAISESWKSISQDEIDAIAHGFCGKVNNAIRNHGKP